MAKVRILTARPHRLLNPLLEELGRLHQAEKRALFLVPEQMTLMAEELIMQRLQLRCLVGLDVVSPTKLYDMLLHHLGSDGTRPLSDMGYRMAVAQVLEGLEDELRYYRRSSRFPGMADKLASLITDLKRGGLNEDTLAELSDKAGSELLKAKFSDLALIFHRYRTLTEGRFHDSEDRMGYISARMRPCECISGKTLFIYGFDNITQQLSSLICALAPYCDETVVSLVCASEKDPDYTLFAPVCESIERLALILAEKQIPVKKTHIETEALHTAPEIAHLDQNLMSKRCSPYAGVVSAISIHSSLRPFEEARLMSRQLLSCLQQGIPLSRIAVMMPDSASYDFAVSAALQDAGIPCFPNRPMRAVTHPLMQFLLLSLKAMENRWNKDCMLSLLQNEYLPLPFEEACELRRYVQAYGIFGERWEKPFARGEAHEISACEGMRIQVMEPLLSCRRELLDAKNALESVQAIYRLLEECGCYEKLCEENERLSDPELKTHAEQSIQIWGCMMEMLDDTVRLAGENRLPLKRIVSRFESGLSAVNLYALPPTGEILQTGILGHMLIEEADVLFLMGLNEGVLTHQTNSLLQEDERAFAVSQSHCFLGLTDVSRNLLSRLDFKNAMTLPKKRLYLSYSETSADGKELETLSELNYMNRTAFGGHIPVNPPAEDLPLSPGQALLELSCMSAEDEALQSPKWQAILKDPASVGFSERLGSILSYTGIPESLSREQCLALYGSNVSVSMLEKYAECRFGHFLSYGLRPAENRLWEIDSRFRGSFSHDALNHFGKLAMEEKDYPEISPERLEKLTASALAMAEETIQESIQNGILKDSARNEAQHRALKGIVSRSVQSLTKQLQDGSFRIVRTEAQFGKGERIGELQLTLADGLPVTLHGAIDRIDSCLSEGEDFLRVIDFKSSEKKLAPGQIQLGTQLQLLLYLNICSQMKANAVPAGALYFHIQDPYTECNTDESLEKDKKLQTEFNMRGLALKDADPFTGGTGKPLHYSSTVSVSREEMGEILKIAKNVARDMAQSLYDGHIDINPSTGSDEEHGSCSHCFGREICRREAKSLQGQLRYPENIKMEEWVKRIRKRMEEEKQTEESD